ncbi:MAG: O-antigen ligase family protein [Planctomycetota bacterium]
MTLFVLMIVAAAMVWLLPLMRRGSLTAWLTAVIVVGVVVGPLYLSFDTPGLRLSIDRILMLLVGGLLAVAFRQGGLERITLVRHDWVLIAFVLWLGCRAVGMTAPEDESPPFSRWLTFIAMPAAIYAMARFIKLERATLRSALSAVLVMGGYLSVIGLLEVTGRHHLVFPRYIVDPEEWEFFGRARGPLMNPIANGIVLLTSLGIATSRWLHSGRYGKVGYGVVVSLVGVGLAATLTRSVWMSCMLLAVLIAMVYLPRWTRVLALASCVFLAAMVAGGGAEGLLSIKRDKELSASAAAKSVELRPLLLIVAWEMFQDRPIFGHGFGGYFETSADYHQIRDYDLPLDTVRPYMQHNVITSIAVDTGLVGVVLLLIWMVSIALVGWRLMANAAGDIETRCLGMMTVACVTGYLVNGMFHDVSVMPMINSVLFYCGALATNMNVSGLADAKTRSVVRATPLGDRRRPPSVALSP